MCTMNDDFHRYQQLIENTTCHSPMHFIRLLLNHTHHEPSQFTFTKWRAAGPFSIVLTSTATVSYQLETTETSIDSDCPNASLVDLIEQHRTEEGRGQKTTFQGCIKLWMELMVRVSTGISSCSLVSYCI